MAHTSTIRFLGGAGTVTGSNFMLDTSPAVLSGSPDNTAGGGAKFLIDCGLFQGKHAHEVSNWEPFPFDPKSISYLINTHAHIDHIGRIPKLVKEGYTGRILSTEATRALAEPMLLDAMELSRRTAEHIGKEPLYDEHDIAQALRQWDVVPYHTVVELGDGVTVEFLDSAHILGSAMAKFTRDGKTIVFTGDLGGGNSPLLGTCEVPKGIDYLVMESVYGNRVRSAQDQHIEALENAIEGTVRRGGTLLIPAFSTERTQDILYEIRMLLTEKKVPSVPVYLDSPLAEKITASFLAYPQYFNHEMQERLKNGEHIFQFPELHYVSNNIESEKIRGTKGAKIILAGSGMSNGGRVVGHEKEILPDPHSTLLIVGYQAAGSLGRRLVEGMKTVEIKGEKVSVRCHIETIYSYSAHMDGDQLLEFVNGLGDSLKQVFVVMGEPASSGFLVQRIRDYLGVQATAPEAGETATIEF